MGMETITISRAEYERLTTQVAALQQENSWLIEQIRLARKQRFGASSERTTPEDGVVQLSYLFNEPECMAREAAPEPDVEAISVKAHARKARRSTQEKLPEDIEVEVIHKTLTDEECVCPQCQGKMHDITTPIKAAPTDPAVIKGSIATSEAIAHIMTQKFVMYSPLYRQEQEYNRAGGAALPANHVQLAVKGKRSVAQAGLRADEG